MDLKSCKVGFIGGGNMARAIGAGLIEKDVLDPKKMWISARTQNTLNYWKNLGACTTLNSSDVIQNCDVVFIAVKPQMFNEVFWSIERRDYGTKLFVSILVGVTLSSLRSNIQCAMQSGNQSIVRTIPNTPLLVGAGITAYCSDETLTTQQESLIREMFSHLGLVEKVSESQMNAIGALAGSGPAFAYQIIEALSDGAVTAGVPRAMATQFASQVLIGAGKMVLETKKHPAQLKDEVCSPGGTTITGIHAMEVGGVRASLMNAIKAAVARSEELGRQMAK